MLNFTKKGVNAEAVVLLNALKQHVQAVYNVAEQFTKDERINTLHQERDGFLAINNVEDCFKRIYLGCTYFFDKGLTNGADSAKAAFAQLLLKHGRNYLNNRDEESCLIIAENDDNVDGTNLGDRISDRLDLLRDEGNYAMPPLEPK